MADDTHLFCHLPLSLIFSIFSTICLYIQGGCRKTLMVYEPLVTIHSRKQDANWDVGVLWYGIKNEINNQAPLVTVMLTKFQKATLEMVTYNKHKKDHFMHHVCYKNTLVTFVIYCHFAFPWSAWLPEYISISFVSW